MSKKKFKDNWMSATDIGRQFGLSAIAVNKLLEARGLRDSVRKAPTESALADEWVLATPMRSGVPHYMWSRKKVAALLRAAHRQLSPAEVKVEEFIRQVLSLENDPEQTGLDKLVHFYIDEELPLVTALKPTEAHVLGACARLKCEHRAAELVALILNSPLPR